MNSHTFNILQAFLLLVVFSASCNKEDDIGPVKVNTDNDPDITDTILTGKYATGVFVLNEGNFQWGNASLSYYHPEKKAVEQRVFEKVNEKALGDILQSMYFFDGKGYLVVDNSDKIEVVDEETMISLTAITVPSPRYFAPVNKSKAYVTSIWSGKIHVIDLNSNKVSSTIPCPGWTNELIQSGPEVFVTNFYRDYLYVIDVSTDQLSDSIQLVYGGESIRKDKNGKLWVLCSGDNNENIKPQLYRINPVSKEVELSLSFGSDDYPSKLNINGHGDVLYYLNQGVCKIPIHSTSLPPAPFIAQSGIYYGLGIDPESGNIYISDVIDYVQEGVVYLYQDNGEQIHSFKTGINPNGFVFR